MLICCQGDYVPEKYKDYKNRTFKKHLDKLDNQLRGIRECSLKGEDKTALRKKLLEMVSESIGLTHPKIKK